MDLQISLLEEIIEKSDGGKIVLDADGRVVLWNQWVAVHTGVTVQAARGRLLTEVFVPPPTNDLQAAVAAAVRLGTATVLEHTTTPHPLPMRHRFQDGRMFQKVTVQALKGRPGRHFCLIDVADVSHLVHSEEQLQAQGSMLKHMAKHDPLTGLPNRTLFREYLQRTHERARRKKTRFAVLYLDIHKLKDINETLGHHMGDLVIKGTGERLAVLLRKSDVVSRLGGDEFTVLADSLEQEEEAAIVAQKMLDLFKEPIACEGREIRVDVSIGIATFPRNGEDPDALLRHADVALYRAKEMGRNTFQFYTSLMNHKANARMTLEKELRRAVSREEFLVYYQPQIDLKSNAVVGAEALLRWNHPEQGVLAPAAFLDLASETGLIVPIGEWVMERVCAQVRDWSQAGKPPFRAAVNISGHHFRKPGAMDTLARVLQRSGVDPGYIELELTEEVLIERVEENIEALWKLREMGVQIAIDDFGTGYSSLSYLKHFPIDTLKIDRCFVQQLLANKKDAIITKGVISLAHDLGLKVIAEGVETEAQLPFLLDQNCDEGQGYFYSRPIPPDAFWQYFLQATAKK